MNFEPSAARNRRFNEVNPFVWFMKLIWVRERFAHQQACPRPFGNVLHRPAKLYFPETIIFENIMYYIFKKLKK